MALYELSLTCVLGAQKNRLIETVLLNTQNICFGQEISKLRFNYTLISGGLVFYRGLVKALNKTYLKIVGHTSLKKYEELKN